MSDGLPKSHAVLMRIRDGVFDAMESFGKQSQTSIQSDLAEPFPPASTPGTPPHMRTGNLREHVSHKTDFVGTMNVSLAVVSDRAPDANSDDSDVPASLEFGTERVKARPFMDPAMMRDAGRVLQHVATGLRNVK